MRPVAAEADKGAPGRGPSRAPWALRPAAQRCGAGTRVRGIVRDPAWGPFLTAPSGAYGRGGRGSPPPPADVSWGTGPPGVSPKPGRTAPVGAARRGQTLGGSSALTRLRRSAEGRPRGRGGAAGKFWPPPSPAPSLPPSPLSKIGLWGTD